MPLINTIIQPVIKSAVQRVDGVIDIPLLLETYSDATAGYSFRDIGANGGAVVRVRNNSDSEQDFTASEVSDGTLASFCNGVGVGDGFVSIWYDQSGNGLNMTQSTADDQPKIVSNGSIFLLNNKPAMNFDGSSDFLTLAEDVSVLFNFDPTSSSYHPVNTIMFVGKNISGNQSFIGKNTNYISAPFSSNVYEFHTATSGTYETALAPLLNSNLILSIQCPSENNFSIRENGVSKTLGGTNNITGSSALSIGTFGQAKKHRGFSSFQNMEVNELVWMKNRLTTEIVDIENDANNFYSVF